MNRFKPRHHFLYQALAVFAFGVIGLGLLISTSAEEETEAIFQVHCSVHHTNKDDPIVFPNQPGRSHMHSFYGNLSTDAATTPQSLMANRSNCGRNMETTDRSAYWVPSMYRKLSDGTLQLAPTREQIAFIYYGRPGGPNGPRITPFPNGFRMIAGNPNATAASPQPLSVVKWGCGGGGGGQQTAYLRACPDPAQPFHVRITFPNCWNGRDLDSPDHKSHMAYPVSGGVCPASHPVSLPQLEFELDYYGVAGSTDHELSSGGQYSMHADFFSAWDPQTLNALVAECLNAARTCTGITKEGNKLVSPPGNPDSYPTINIANYPTTLPVVPNPTTPSPSPTPSPTPGHTPGHMPTPTPTPTTPPATPSPTPTPTPTTPPPTSGKIGDLNNDNRVNITDLSILLSHWGQNHAPADLNGDGTINLIDLSIILSRWNK